MVASNSKAGKVGGAPADRVASPEHRVPSPEHRVASPADRVASPEHRVPSPEHRVPSPGRPVRGSRTGRPAMALLDLLGRRWALRALWELRDGEQLTFRELQARCGEISSSVLNDRLRELREADIVAGGTGGYRLTQEGAKLLDALAPLDEWAKRWAKRVSR